jgi:hypothetical protein
MEWEVYHSQEYLHHENWQLLPIEAFSSSECY